MKEKTKLTRAVKFVLLIGIMSFFADFTYEGARSILDPYLGMLSASVFTISVVTVFREHVRLRHILVYWKCYYRVVLQYFNFAPGSFCLVTEFAAIPPLLRLKAEMACQE
jgi:hypothetical protein